MRLFHFNWSDVQYESRPRTEVPTSIIIIIVRTRVRFGKQSEDARRGSEGGGTSVGARTMTKVGENERITAGAFYDNIILYCDKTRVLYVALKKRGRTFATFRYGNNYCIVSLVVIIIIPSSPRFQSCDYFSSHRAVYRVGFFFFQPCRGDNDCIFSRWFTIDRRRTRSGDLCGYVVNRNGGFRLVAPRTLVEKNKKKVAGAPICGKRMGTVGCARSSRPTVVGFRRDARWAFRRPLRTRTGLFDVTPFENINSGAYRTSRERSESKSVQISQIVSGVPMRFFFVLDCDRSFFS